MQNGHHNGSLRPMLCSINSPVSWNSRGNLTGEVGQLTRAVRTNQGDGESVEVEGIHQLNVSLALGSFRTGGAPDRIGVAVDWKRDSVTLKSIDILS
ncbi:hypothetical protein R1flu_014846 [Riccia fluitans]|uniref:Uncharacterized protein n=1 Tax=Riccia fluitans TaxID=41844 RepID=A0ABD1YI46_9MARC